MSLSLQYGYILSLTHKQRESYRSSLCFTQCGETTNEAAMILDRTLANPKCQRILIGYTLRSLNLVCQIQDGHIPYGRIEHMFMWVPICENYAIRKRSRPRSYFEQREYELIILNGKTNATIPVFDEAIHTQVTATYQSQIQYQAGQNNTGRTENDDMQDIFKAMQKTDGENGIAAMEDISDEDIIKTLLEIPDPGDETTTDYSTFEPFDPCAFENMLNEPNLFEKMLGDQTYSV